MKQPEVESITDLPRRIIVTICFRLAAYNSDAWATDPSLLQAPFAVWTQSEMNLSIICATATGLQRYLKDFDTHFGGLNPDDSSYVARSQYGIASGKQNSHGFEMSVVNPTTVDIEEQDRASTTDIPTDKVLNRQHGSIRITKGDDGSSSIASNGSQQMIIRKDISWTVVPDD